ncbi:MAG TPA: succinate dehydrogenase assembly factor 2 [Stellaceae bacterium]|nr:succinate dehydrogenase assembly factor 2 [Stellaceae bacterium]
MSGSEAGAGMTEFMDVRRKKLLFRSWHRGTREADLLLGPYADSHVAQMTPAELDQFEALLEEADDDLYDWISGRVEAPPDRFGALLRRLRDSRVRQGPA